MATRPVQYANEAQVAFIKRLIRERNTDVLTEHQRNWLESTDFSQLSGHFGGGASRVIEALKKLPKAEEQSGTVRKDWPDVPAGRYAVENELGNLCFYHVDRPDEGRWAGYTFLAVRASDELHPIKNNATKRAIMEKIAVDPQAAMLLYGKEIGSCGHCGRTLTNPVSREIGIGPICRAKMGW